jgi:putative toxin-antitoxin system antitoxin component (TIGR02293 family)
MSRFGRDLLQGMQEAACCAEILVKATTVFGAQEKAIQWLHRPAIGLDHRRPLDLLATPAGVKLVEQYLGRLEYGVYT